MDVTTQWHPKKEPSRHDRKAVYELEASTSRAHIGSMDAPQERLPTPRHFVASIILALKSTAPPTANPLADTADTKQLLVTLHVLFHNELSSALDLLDRGLVTRLILRMSNFSKDQPAMSDDSHKESDARHQPNGRPRSNGRTTDTSAARTPSVYLVRSAQPQQSSRSTASRFRNEPTTYREVRLDAWSCSCPAFTFSAFPATHTATPGVISSIKHAQGTASWSFGGLSRGSDMPVCKHLLACVLVEHGGMFAHMAEERTVSAGEMAGWAAGWGD
ncbi:hypothetical protein LTR53_009613 [Teratosphaeriaceae sp. CCFEE 6253]|nr:hypothetical protein LTR53_009613 [Teratosphaeriaceae sp. CCFEE 6253]